MESESNISVIEKYFEGTLGETEKKAFEKRIFEDQAFADEVKNYGLARKSIEEFGKQELKQKLGLIHEQEIVGRNKKLRTQLLRIAAVFVGLLLVSSPFLYDYFLAAPDYERLYKENFALYPDILSQRSSETGNLLLDEAMSYYKSKDFENATALFKEIEKQNISGDAVSLYTGISLLGAERFSEAESIFLNILTEPENPFHEQARWYLALTYLHKDKIEEAETVLKKISASKSYNFSKAGKLLEELE